MTPKLTKQELDALKAQPEWTPKMEREYQEDTHDPRAWFISDPDKAMRFVYRAARLRSEEEVKGERERVLKEFDALPCLPYPGTLVNATVVIKVRDLVNCRACISGATKP